MQRELKTVSRPLLLGVGSVELVSVEWTEYKLSDLYKKCRLMVGIFMLWRLKSIYILCLSWAIHSVYSGSNFKA